MHLIAKWRQALERRNRSRALVKAHVMIAWRDGEEVGGALRCGGGGGRHLHKALLPLGFCAGPASFALSFPLPLPFLRGRSAQLDLSAADADADAAGLAGVGLNIRPEVEGSEAHVAPCPFPSCSLQARYDLQMTVG